MATRKGIKLYFAGVMCFVAALTVLTVPVLGQDAGAPDSIKLVLSVAPVEGTNVPVVVECSVFVDSNQLSILQFGWYWDNVNLQMDSAIASSAFEAMEIGPFFFIYNDLQTTNDSQIAAASGTAIFALFPTSSSWQHLCTYYMTASTWTDSSSLQIDTIQHPDITGTDYFFLPVSGTDYNPIWGGPIHYSCGDVNGDGNAADVLDLTYILDYFYRGGAAPPVMAAADMDGCPGVDVRDFTFLIARIFRGGPAPCTGPINCAAGVDAGAPDSLKLALSTLPVVGTNVPVVVECSVYVDSNSLSTLQFAWEWDNTNLQMDSAVASSEFYAIEIGPFFFLDNVLTTTNDSQIAICSGTSILTYYPPNASGWRHIATYYMTASSWADTSTLTIDTVQIPGLAATEYIFIPTGGQFYRPVWGGAISLPDSIPGTPLNLILEPTELYFIASQGGTLPVTQSFILSNSGSSGTIDWSLTYDSLWLSVSPQSGNDNYRGITVSILTTNKPPDSYYENIVVESPDADNSPQIVNVEYIVDTSTALPDSILLNPTELHFVASQGGTLPVTQNFIISNSNFSQTLDWSLTYDSLWLSVSPQSGNDDYRGITVSILTTNKPPDSYYENIVVESPQADNSPQIVNVEYVVTSPCCIGTRGDLNGDGDDANILDLTFAVDRIFRGGGPSACPEEGDVNGDGNPHNILDLTFLVDRIFRGGPPPGPC